jgi:hypothetical protein
MLSTAQKRLAHSIASLGLVPYPSLITELEKKSPEIESWKRIRQIFDQPAGEQTLLEMYRFARRAVATGTAFEQACWVWMLRYQSLTTFHRYQELQQSLAQEDDEAQLDADAHSYLLERIRVCLQDDPWAEEWRAQQLQAHQNYDFWWTGLEASEAQAWKQAHPRSTTDMLWKVGQGHAATPMICRSGSLEELLASTKRALAALELWMKRFGTWEREGGQQVLQFYATKGLRDIEDGFILGCFGQLSRAQIGACFQRNMEIYMQGVERVREAKVPFVLQWPIGPLPLKVKRNQEIFSDFLAFLNELEDVPVVVPKGVTNG